MPLLARDVMQTHLIQVGPETPLVDVHRLFVEEGISGAPVVDDTGRLLGVVSSSDLLRAVAEERDTAVADPHYYRENLEFSGPDWSHGVEDFQDRLAERSVADVMTEGGATVAPDTPIPEVARAMRQGRIHRVFVVQGEALVGIITSFDLVALLEKG
jgi:CBS domain-containing protein